ncbi:MAG TPA: tetratricopeptide repeat protein [Puia sp.]|nr:tetratricopeptide repeat protein [Puia sp.]
MISLCFLLTISCGHRNRREEDIMTHSIVRVGSNHIYGDYAKKEYEQALNLINERKFEEAKQCFFRADSADPNNPEILTDLGGIMGTLYTNEASYSYFDRAIMIDSGLYRAYSNYAFWLNRGHRYKEAIYISKKGLSLHEITQDQRRPIYLNLADAFHQIGHDSLALIVLSDSKKGLAEGPLLEKINQQELILRKSYNNRGFVPFEDTTDAVKILEHDYKKIKNTDYLGELITLIDFRVKTNNRKDYPDGYITSISIDHPETEIENLIDKNEEPGVLYNVRNISILYDYPLKYSCTIGARFSHKITKKVLVNLISDNYHSIYQKEEETAPVKPVPPSKRILGNQRHETNGSYGIWAHDLSDLRLEECKVYRKKDGSILLTLKIEN